MCREAQGCYHPLSIRRTANDRFRSGVPCTRLLERLTQEGYEVASAGFASAEYDGTNDVTVSVEDRGKIKAVVAVGGTVLFIEFGTGVTYPDNHPEARDLGMERGEYGHGRG